MALPAAVSPWTKLPLRQLLENTSEFVAVAELATSRGLITDANGRQILTLARALAEHPRFHALSITDNPGGHAMLSADTIGTDLIYRGQEVIIHLSCKDWNRNALESRCWMLASEGFRNVLALSGDYPVTGYQGQASPVFDIDSVGLLNSCSEIQGGNFFPGAVVTNYKRLEREVMPQYFKLARKIHAGARFIINQIGYDARKMDELLKYMALHGLNVPVMANVFVLSATAARYFHSGKIPGVTVTDELMALVEKQAASPDKGKAFLLEFAAKQCAIARGLGYRGIYLGGHLDVEDYDRILGLVDSFGPDDWRDFAREIRFSQPGEFYYFERDSATRPQFHRDQPRLPAIETGSSAGASRVQTESPRPRPFFLEGTPAFRAGTELYQIVERSPKLARLLHHAEARRQNRRLRLPRLRRLLAARDRLALPRVAMRQEPAQRPLRRHPRGPLRGRRQGMHLGARLRAPQAVRRGGAHARGSGRLPQWRAAGHERLGQRFSGSRPPRAKPSST